eukprot:Skav207344  [mRNA]  locus=scaffold426:87345:88826:+ [translate_table: standard]
MHFKRIHCFEGASPYSSNAPTRSSSPIKKQQLEEGDTAETGSPDSNKKTEETPELKPSESKVELEQEKESHPSDKKEQPDSNPGPAQVTPRNTQETEGPRSPGNEDVASKPDKQPPQASHTPQEPQVPEAPQTPPAPPAPAPQAPPASKAQAPKAVAAFKAYPKAVARKPSPALWSAPSALSTRPPDKQIQPFSPAKSNSIQHTPVCKAQPSLAGSSSVSTAQKVQNSNAPLVPSQQPQTTQSNAIMRTDNPPKIDPTGLPQTGTANAVGTAAAQAHVKAAPAAKNDEGQSILPKQDALSAPPQAQAVQSQPISPLSQAAWRKNVLWANQSMHLNSPPEKPSRPSSAPTARPAARQVMQPKSAARRPGSARPAVPSKATGAESMVTIQTPGRLPPPTEPSTSSSTPPQQEPIPMQTRGRERVEPAQDLDDYEVYSYTGSSRSPSPVVKKASRQRSSSPSDGASRSSSHGRQRGNEFLPDISVHVKMPLAELIS